MSVNVVCQLLHERASRCLVAPSKSSDNAGGVLDYVGNGGVFCSCQPRQAKRGLWISQRRRRRQLLHLPHNLRVAFHHRTVLMLKLVDSGERMIQVESRCDVLLPFFIVFWGMRKSVGVLNSSLHIPVLVPNLGYTWNGKHVFSDLTALYYIRLLNS